MTSTTLIMQENKLQQAFGDIVKLPPDIWSAFMGIVVYRHVPKKTMLQEAGKLCHQVHFIESGIARTFFYRDGRDVTTWIAAENEFIGSMASFFNRTISDKYVETLDDTILWDFSYSKLEALYNQSKEMERMGRLFAQYGIGLWEKRFDDFHFLTAKERYDLLVQKHPAILQRVSLGIIASYLGITQETLSRIRAQS